MPSVGVPELSCVFIFVPICLGTTAFWIWMLIDCLKNEPPGSNEKLIWVLVILFGHLLGAVIYFFVRRVERLKAATPGGSGTVPPLE